MKRSHRNRPALVCVRGATMLAAVLFSITVVRPSFAQAPAPWAGCVQCQFDVQGAGYAHQEVQTWTIVGPVSPERTDVQVYPATWSVTGKGSMRKMTGGNTETAEWTVAVPPMAAKIGVTTHAD